jgi:cyclopropane fatty-acyl-phospholipid synthase-like methyltransferase
MDSDRELTAVRYSAMRWNTPLSEAHADVLIERLDAGAVASVLDLGCGWAELLSRVLESAHAECLGTGVDTDGALLQRAATLIAHRGLTARINLVQGQAQDWIQPADRVICIGASHAWGGTASALQALSTVVAPGGRLLFGDGCWVSEPTTEALAIFGQDIARLADVIEHALSAGWRLVSLTTADQREWDDFESSWRLGREQWLRTNPDASHAADVRQELDDRLREYVGAYRGVLGFCYLVLTR